MRRALPGVLAVLFACGGGTGRPQPDLPAVDVWFPGTDTDTGPGVITFDLGPVDPGPVAIDGADEPDAGPPVLICGPRTQVIYVVTEENRLLTFSPALNEFKEIGTLDCWAGAATPFSMGIDNEATAWVLYNDGSLFKVSTLDASCQKTSFQTGWDGANFGMGFATDSPGGTLETLYVSRYTEIGAAPFGRLKLPDLQIYTVGETPGGSGELSGNGLAELWGFFPNASPATVSRIDKTNGSLLKTLTLSGLSSDVAAWAFATWGGQFFVFFKAWGDPSSRVIRLAADGTQATVVGDSGWTITGAGVSSCAPSGAPKGASWN